MDTPPPLSHPRCPMLDPSPSRTPVPKPAGRRTVLVADDYPENRRLLYFYLREHYEVLQSATAEGALQMLRERQLQGDPVDIAILDLNFCDGMSGMEAIRILRDDPAIAGTRTLALTAYAYPHDRERCLEAGFDGYASKPVFKPGLLDALDALLGPNAAGDGAASEAEAAWLASEQKNKG